MIVICSGRFNEKWSGESEHPQTAVAKSYNPYHPFNSPHLPLTDEPPLLGSVSPPGSRVSRGYFHAR